MAILRREAAAGYPHHYCTLRMRVARAGLAISPDRGTGPELAWHIAVIPPGPA
jgi:hypothetical protein